MSPIIFFWNYFRITDFRNCIHFQFRLIKHKFVAVFRKILICGRWNETFSQIFLYSRTLQLSCYWKQAHNLFINGLNLIFSKKITQGNLSASIFYWEKQVNKSRCCNSYRWNVTIIFSLKNKVHCYNFWKNNIKNRRIHL